MLSHVSIKNYQSLGEVSLDLKPLTVIVGPSSSGKSAFARALKTLTGNQRGDSFITHGETQCVITATTDRGVVALLRGKKNEYVIVYPEGGKQSWTKLNGSVPEEVSQFIGIPAGDSLNYADQFDMPYMLKRSGGDVARELGALTNVSVIFEASREANRRRLGASGTLKTRAADYESLTKNLDSYRGLKDAERAIEDAEQDLIEAQQVQTRISGIAAALTKLAAVPDVPAARAIPDTRSFEELHTRIKNIEQLIAAVKRSDATVENCIDVSAAAYQKRTQAEEEYSEALRDAGTCPTCGQDTHGIHL